MMWAIIKVTFWEGLRNKAVFGIALLAGLMMMFTVVLSGMIMRDVGKVAADLTLSTATFASLLVVLFVGINILARDFERKTIYLALARAVPRSRYLVARFLGLGVLQAFIVLLLLFVSLSTLLLVKNIYSGYFGLVSLKVVALAHLFVLVQMLLISSMSMFFSMVASSSFVTFMLTTISWIIGSSTQEVMLLVESDTTLHLSPVTKMIVTLAYYLFPNLSLFDFKAIAAHGLAVDVQRISISLGYGLAYMVAVLALTIILFKRKELT